MEPIKIQVDINIGERTEAFLTKLFSGVAMPNCACNCGTELSTDIRPVDTKIAAPKAPAKPAPTTAAAKPATTPVKPAQTKPAATPAPSAPAAPAATPAPSVPAAPAASSTKTTASEAPSNLTITDVRKMLATKVNKNREVIKGKLGEYGVANVTTLPEDKYPEFYDFLKALD